MNRPRLLDLFCCQGGAAMGYHRAGFDVLGVDIEPQPLYPFPMVQADALEFLATADLSPFAAVHASPPCQKFTQMSARWRGNGGIADQHLDLLTPTLAALAGLRVPWVVENVVGAKRILQPTLALHGGMFDLGIHRPRLFRSNCLILAPKAAMTAEPIGVYGTAPDGRRLWTRQNGNMTGKRPIIRAAKSVEEARELMGMPWADWHGCKEAIPPVYTEFIGRQLMDALANAA
jgi:DNA (cytosine-5)-methyltransferase 1